MDWGLFDKNAGENTFLREEIVYSTVSIVQMKSTNRNINYIFHTLFTHTGLLLLRYYRRFGATFPMGFIILLN